MKSINLFEVGEAVYVKAVVTGMTIDQGEIKYHLKNDVTGRNYDHLFCGNQLFPSEAMDLDESDYIPHEDTKKLAKNTNPIVD